MLLNLMISSFFSLAGFDLASPAIPIIRKLDPLRYQYEKDDFGNNHLVDLWMTLDDLNDSIRNEPTTITNVYHLFTRLNPSVSQPLVQGNEAILTSSNYNSNKRTIVLIHGWRGDATAELNSVLVPALLDAEDLNVLVVDWSSSAGIVLYPVAQRLSILVADAISQFVDWLNLQTGSQPSQYHIIGHNLGGHMAGIVGRRVAGDVAYITGLDPSLIGWVRHPDRFQADDGLYTEVIHTNVGLNGYFGELAQVDFYPNGGESMPGCDTPACDHARSYFYFAESVRTGGFTGRQCGGALLAVLQTCSLPLTLQMGGLTPKPGFSGVYGLQTNAGPPFSQG